MGVMTRRVGKTAVSMTKSSRVGTRLMFEDKVDRRRSRGSWMTS